MLCDAKAWGKGLRSGQLGEAVAACLSVDGVLCDAAVASFADQLEALEAHLLAHPAWRLVSSSLLFTFDAEPAPGGTSRDPNHALRRIAASCI
jgi:hypothetical protein